MTYISGIEIVIPCVLISIQGNGGYNRRKKHHSSETTRDRDTKAFGGVQCITLYAPFVVWGGAEQRIISSWVLREGSELREMRPIHTLCMYRTRVEPVAFISPSDVPFEQHAPDIGSYVLKSSIHCAE